MRSECRLEISKTLGRKLTPEEANNWRSAFGNAMDRLNRQDPAKWAQMPYDQRQMAAVQEVAKDFKEQVQHKKFQARRQIMSQQRCLREYKRLNKEEDIHAYSAVASILTKVDQYSRGVVAEYMRDMIPVLQAFKGKMMGMMEDPAEMLDFAREVYGQDSGNARMKEAAARWKEVSHSMIGRLRANGVDIGEVAEGYIPQSHDAWKVRKAAKRLGVQGVSDQEAWVNFIFPLLDKSRYLDGIGRQMSDRQITEMLGDVYRTIVTGGNADPTIDGIAEKARRRTFGGGSLAGQHRVIHFKDGDSYFQYSQMFSHGSLPNALINSVQGKAKDIALAERMGPTPTSTFGLLKKIADGEASAAQATEGAGRRFAKYADWNGAGAGIDAVWATLLGESSVEATNSEVLARVMQGARNLNVAGKLGYAVVSSISDAASYFAVARFNRIGIGEAFNGLKMAFGRDWREYAPDLGIISESFTADMDRWSGQNLSDGWTGKLAQATMKASGLTAYTDWVRRAFSLTMYRGLGRMIKNEWGSLDAYDRARLSSAGIDEVDWKIMRDAGVDVRDGKEFVSPLHIRKWLSNLDEQQIRTYALEGISARRLQEVPSKIVGWVVSESEMASLNPDLVTKAGISHGTQKGSIKGEILRSLFLFKSFPLSFMRQHFDRMQWLQRHGQGADRLSYAAWIVVGSTVCGAISLQLNNLLKGKDLQDMSTQKFWTNAMTKGGGLGFLGDFIANSLDKDSRYGAWGTIQFLGPVASDALEAYDLAASIIDKGLYDKDTKPAARAVRMLRSHTPFVNMWYTSAAVDRAIMNEVQESLSPGYLSKMETRARNSWGQGYWWRPGQLEPSRMPRMATEPNK